LIWQEREDGWHALLVHQRGRRDREGGEATAGAILSRGETGREAGGEREREPAGATGRSASGWNEDRREILGMREDPDRKLQKRMQRPKEAAQWCFFLHFAYARRDGVTVRDGLIHVFCMSTS
jgi:hypothetical protein